MGTSEAAIMVRLRIEGRVQGVWFRDWTRREAQSMGLSGWVRNLADGAVEARLEGDKEAVRAMIGKCHTGPRLARVDRVMVLEERELTGRRPSGSFDILPTAG